MKLVAIDLDGTLLSEDCMISEENTKAVKEAQQQGHIITIATGRSIYDTKQILAKVGIDCPVIAANGAIVVNRRDVLRSLAIPTEIVLELQTLLENNNFYFEIYTNKGIFILEEGRVLLHEEIENTITEQIEAEIEIQYQQFGLHSIKDFHQLNVTKLEVYKLFVLTFNADKLKNLHGKLARRVDISLTTSGTAKLEVGHPQTSKGNALQFLAEYLKIPLNETFAIGDNLNDLSMFKVAGTSIAMGNAEEVLKFQSTYVTTHHNENGVAEALRRYVING